MAEKQKGSGKPLGGKWIWIVAAVLLVCTITVYLATSFVKVDVNPSVEELKTPNVTLEEDPLAPRTMEDMVAYMAPALVQVYRTDGAGNYSAGSGYIMELTEDRVYICSNRHAVTNFAACDIYFYDGTCVEGKILGAGAYYDVGVVTVERGQISDDLWEQLKPVTIDYTYWEGLDEEPISLGLGRISREGGFDHITTGNLVKVKQDFEFDFSHPHTEVTVELREGDSGSAIFDFNGNLIAMAYAYSTEPMRYWCVPLDEIIANYKELTGRNPRVF